VSRAITALRPNPSLKRSANGRPQKETIVTNQEKYREAASQALCGFQLIEEGLKTYIQTYHNTVKSYLPPEITYKHTGADVQDASLGKLVNVFSKISARDDVIVELRSLTRARDELAHSAFLGMVGTSSSEIKSHEKIAEFQEVTKKLTHLLLEIAREMTIMLLHRQPKASALP